MSWLFEKTSNIDKPLSKLTKVHSDSIQIKIRNDKQDITTESEEIFLKNHQILLQKPLLNKTGKSR